MIFKRKKPAKKERIQSPEEKHKLEQARKEAKRWYQIWANVSVYDGTERGQKHFE